MANLAIKGHPTRGKEVIQLLEMLGANRLGYKDTFVGFYYYIECGAICSSDEYPTYSTIFTLEEFLEKYPYKVGDEVIAYAEGILASFSIKGMRWNNKLNKVEYKICSSWYDVSMLSAIQPYTDYNIKEETTEKNQPPKTQAEVDKYLQEHSIKNGMNVIDIETCLETDGLKLPENVVINSKGIGSIQFIQWYEKTKYPKTYEECYDILGLLKPSDDDSNIFGYNTPLLSKFQKLLICRDAYWKIAGEQMGLDKPWEPDWCDEHNMKYIIYICRNKINVSISFVNSHFLAFPTAEMRYAFFENFKELIEQCKELLCYGRFRAF